MYHVTTSDVYADMLTDLDNYSKHPHIRTHDFGSQADRVLI